MFKKKTLCSILCGFGLMLTMGAATAFADSIDDSTYFSYSYDNADFNKLIITGLDSSAVSKMTENQNYVFTIPSKINVSDTPDNKQMVNVTEITNLGVSDYYRNYNIQFDNGDDYRIETISARSGDVKDNIGPQNSPFKGKVKIPASVKTIAEYALSSPDITALDLSAAIELTTLPNYMCKDATMLDTLKLNDSITDIGTNAFDGSGIKSVTLPAKLKSIGNCAFQNCTELTTLKIPKDMNGSFTIGSGAFAGCTQLQIECAEDGTKTQMDNYSIVSGVLYSADKKTLKLYPGSCTPTNGELTLGDGQTLENETTNGDITETLGQYCIQNTNITKITLGAQVETLELGALEGCRNLKTLDMSKARAKSCEQLGHALVDIMLEKLIYPATATNITEYSIPYEFAYNATVTLPTTKNLIVDLYDLTYSLNGGWYILPETVGNLKTYGDSYMYPNKYEESSKERKKTPTTMFIPKTLTDPQTNADTGETYYKFDNTMVNTNDPNHYLSYEKVENTLTIKDRFDNCKVPVILSTDYLKAESCTLKTEEKTGVAIIDGLKLSDEKFTASSDGTNNTNATATIKILAPSDSDGTENVLCTSELTITIGDLPALNIELAETGGYTEPTEDTDAKIKVEPTGFKPSGDENTEAETTSDIDITGTSWNNYKTTVKAKTFEDENETEITKFVAQLCKTNNDKALVENDFTVKLKSLKMPNLVVNTENQREKAEASALAKVTLNDDNDGIETEIADSYIESLTVNQNATTDKYECVVKLNSDAGDATQNLGEIDITAVTTDGPDAQTILNNCTLEFGDSEKFALEPDENGYTGDATAKINIIYAKNTYDQKSNNATLKLTNDKLPPLAFTADTLTYPTTTANGKVKIKAEIAKSEPSTSTKTSAEGSPITITHDGITNSVETEITDSQCSSINATIVTQGEVETDGDSRSYRQPYTLMIQTENNGNTNDIFNNVTLKLNNTNLPPLAYSLSNLQLPTADEEAKVSVAATIAESSNTGNTTVEIADSKIESLTVNQNANTGKYEAVVKLNSYGTGTTQNLGEINVGAVHTNVNANKRKIIVRRTTRDVTYAVNKLGTITTSTDPLTDHKKDAPTPLDAEVLTYEYDKPTNAAEDIFKFTLSPGKAKNIRDYRVTSTDGALTENSNDTVKEYKFDNNSKDIVIITIEQYCDNIDTGTYSKGAQYNTAWTQAWRTKKTKGAV